MFQIRLQGAYVHLKIECELGLYDISVLSGGTFGWKIKENGGKRKLCESQANEGRDERGKKGKDKV